jgi:hypothetical protein
MVQLGVAVRRFASCLVIVAALLAQAHEAWAADLRITYAELTRIVDKVAGESKIYLNTVPGLFSQGSYISVGGQQRSLTIPNKQFSLAGSVYTYYITDLSSGSVRISPIDGGLRLTISFPKDGPVLTGECVSGGCTLGNALPSVVWPGAMAMIDFVPVQYNGSVSLKVTSVQLLGNPRLVCRTNVDFFSESACAIARQFSTSTIQNTKLQVAKSIKDEINNPEIQAQLAEGLKKYLSLGPAGAIAINSLSIDPKSMTVRFVFATGN